MIPFLITLLYLCFPLACILAIPSGSRPGSLAERFVFGIALYEFLLLLFGLMLGLTGHLTVPAYLALVGAASSLLALQAYRNGLKFRVKSALRGIRFLRYIHTWRGAATALLMLLATTSFVVQLTFDFLYGTRHGDGLWYHIPRVMFWTQQGNFAAWTTPVAASIGLPVGADLILLHKMLLGLGWGGSALVTCFLSLGSIFCVYLAALNLGLRRWHATLSAILFASFPAIGLRIWSVNSDIAAAFPVFASYLALHRIRNPKLGLAIFLLLNAMAIACKPTVAPPAVILACVTLWQCRHKLTVLRRELLPYAAAVFGAVLAISSYWPVYLAFSDFLGGDYSRAHRSSDLSGYLNAVAMHTGYWSLEPLGYLTRFKEHWEVELVRSVYNALGAQFETLPDMWKPYPGQDTGYTGLASVLALPLLLAGFSVRARIAATLVFLLGYLPLSGMINPQPYFSRYNVILLAGFALLWGGTGLFRRGKRRWFLIGIVALNSCALLGAVSINAYLHATKWSRDGGLYHYISDGDRDKIAASLEGRPLLIVTESSTNLSSMDALLTGPQIAFPIKYLVCPDDGDWVKNLSSYAGGPNWLALVHNGRNSIIPGPDFERPGVHACSEVPIGLVQEALRSAGWTRYRNGKYVDFWKSF
jgi:hypothetical protein